MIKTAVETLNHGWELSPLHKNTVLSPSSNSFKDGAFYVSYRKYQYRVNFNTIQHTNKKGSITEVSKLFWNLASSVEIDTSDFFSIYPTLKQSGQISYKICNDLEGCAHRDIKYYLYGCASPSFFYFPYFHIFVCYENGKGEMFQMFHTSMPEGLTKDFVHGFCHEYFIVLDFAHQQCPMV